MNLEPYIAVSGQSGLFELVNSRGNGLVLKSLADSKVKFYSVRKHQFTPLGTVAMYTLEGTKPLSEVFQTMFDKKDSHPVVSLKSEKHIIEEYVEAIIPDYDEDKVSFSDMKKLIKWFSFLDEEGLLKQAESSISSDKSEEE